MYLIVLCYKIGICILLILLDHPIPFTASHRYPIKGFFFVFPPFLYNFFLFPAFFLFSLSNLVLTF